MVWYNLVMKNYIRAETFLLYYSFTGDISSPRQARLNIRLMKQAVQQQILHYTPYGMAYHRSYHECLNPVGCSTGAGLSRVLIIKASD